MNYLNTPASIYEAQYYLYVLSGLYNTIPKVKPDGIYGKETAEAVRMFQRQFGIPETGEIDLGTWTLLVEKFEAAEELRGYPERISVFPPEIQAFYLGAKSDEIMIYQIMLKRIALRFRNVPPPSVNGVYDNPTRESVSALQGVFGMEENGITDKVTWNRVARLYSVFTNND
ncbi:MAG: peptidoglycan-binding protein [Clostridia bacterium]|nr:peptidoglycan-binding protein [Clostridia bacterium]